MSEPPIPNQTNDPAARLERAKAADVPKIYFNGFQTALTNADVVMTAERNDEPVALFNMSYTTAKTLAKALQDTISLLEKRAGREMLTTHDFEAIMKASEE